ncbi:unnamed protein product [Notodromas monacha]|uniref:Uncharacterized protein n=1 Tax=Notodromas monacha TaxID=399045 RepID=A0A7R9BCI9_9CRUS|nr:unnamed protein product [Notodromas monacha]CAG0912780.1 unnamed protein product [Notodromas monacha]
MIGVSLVVLCFMLQLGNTAEHWPNYWSPIDGVDVEMVDDGRSAVPAPRVFDDAVVGRRQLYLDPKPPLTVQHLEMSGFEASPPDAKGTVLNDETLVSSWVPIEPNPMKGEPLHEYKPPALKTVKLDKFAQEEEDSVGTASIIPRPLGDQAPFLLASAGLLDSMHAADSREQTEPVIFDDRHPYYGAGRIKLDSTLKDRLPTFTNSQETLYNPNPSLRRTTILPSITDQETISQDPVETTTSRLIYQSPPPRPKTTSPTTKTTEDESLLFQPHASVRPLRFPTEKPSRRPSLSTIEELSKAVQPLVSSVPFVIVQGHSKVKMYGMNTLEGDSSKKHTPGSKTDLEDKQKAKEEDEAEEKVNASTESEAGVVRPIATKKPKPAKPSEVRFPEEQEEKEVKKVRKGPKRPNDQGQSQQKQQQQQQQQQQQSKKPPPAQGRPTRPVFFTKRNPGGAQLTHSNPFEYFSQLARLTASRIRTPVPKPSEEPLKPRTG